MWEWQTSRSKPIYVTCKHASGVHDEGMKGRCAQCPCTQASLLILLLPYMISMLCTLPVIVYRVHVGVSARIAHQRTLDVYTYIWTCPSSEESSILHIALQDMCVCVHNYTACVYKQPLPGIHMQHTVSQLVYSRFVFCNQPHTVEVRLSVLSFYHMTFVLV